MKKTKFNGLYETIYAQCQDNHKLSQVNLVQLRSLRARRICITPCVGGLQEKIKRSVCIIQRKYFNIFFESKKLKKTKFNGLFYKLY
jgi:hypothetical protein